MNSKSPKHLHHFQTLFLCQKCSEPIQIQEVLKNKPSAKATIALPPHHLWPPQIPTGLCRNQSLAITQLENLEKLALFFLSTVQTDPALWHSFYPLWNLLSRFTLWNLKICLSCYKAFGDNISFFQTPFLEMNIKNIRFGILIKVPKVNLHGKIWYFE